MTIKEYVNEQIRNKSIIIDNSTAEATAESPIQSICVMLQNGQVWEDDFVSSWYLNRLKRFKYRNADVLDVYVRNHRASLMIAV